MTRKSKVSRFENTKKARKWITDERMDGWILLFSTILERESARLIVRTIKFAERERYFSILLLLFRKTGEGKWSESRFAVGEQGDNWQG